MPRENSPTRRPAAEVRSTRLSTSSILDGLTSPSIAWMRRWLRAVRPGWASEASRTAPTMCSGWSSCWYGRPLMVALPPVGVARPSSMRRVVVFPAPFGPRKPTTRPDSTSKLKWSTATSSPKRLVRSCNSITATAANLPVRPGYRRGASRLARFACHRTWSRPAPGGPPWSVW